MNDDSLRMMCSTFRKAIDHIEHGDVNPIGGDTDDAGQSDSDR